MFIITPQQLPWVLCQQLHPLLKQFQCIWKYIVKMTLNILIIHLIFNYNIYLSIYLSILSTFLPILFCKLLIHIQLRLIHRWLHLYQRCHEVFLYIILFLHILTLAKIISPPSRSTSHGNTQPPEYSRRVALVSMQAPLSHFLSS